MKKFNILVIDDNVRDWASLYEILEANDFNAKTAVNGEAGFELLAKESFDLIFLEVELDKMDSYRICQSIKSNPDYRNIPVVFIIDSNDLMVVKDIYDSGGDDYVVKPFIWSELVKKLRFHLELKFSREISKNMNQILESKVAQRTMELEDSYKNLEKAKRELELLSVAKTEFLNLISHEIRTPLNGILGSLALIGRYHYTDEVNHYFSLLDSSVKRLEKFSNTILEASTLRLKGEKALVMNKIDLVSVIQEAIDQCTTKFPEKGIEIILQKDTSKSTITGDRKFLLKCFYAVLDNAFKFSPKGGKVEIKLANEGNGFLKTTIVDFGKGFSKTAMDSIYMPFSNLEAHFDQNTGMGLHLAKLILDAHSGYISAGNREQKGAIIEIKIPTLH